MSKQSGVTPRLLEVSGCGHFQRQEVSEEGGDDGDDDGEEEEEGKEEERVGDE